MIGIGACVVFVVLAFALGMAIGLAVASSNKD